MNKVLNKNIILKECKGILLDLDDTLYDYNKCNTLSLEKVFNHIAEKFSLLVPEVELAFKIARKEVNTALVNTASSHNRMLYFQKMFELLNLDSLRYSLEAYGIYWDTFLSIMEYEEGVCELLEKLCQTKKICLVTDLTVHIQHRKVEKLKLYNYVRYMVSSEEAGKEKPAANIFLLALQKMNLESSEVCMIGDNYAKDIQGAININIMAFWLNRDDKLERSSELVTEIKNFKELEKYV